jgi:hypothetical protein
LVTFTPQRGDFVSADLIFEYGLSGRDDIFIGGAGAPSSLIAFPSSIQFGTQFADVAPILRTVTLSSVSTSPLTITDISVAGQFAQRNDCTDTLQPHESCHIGVSFVPSGNGNRTGVLSVTHDGAGGVQTVNLSGLAKILSDLSVSPLELAFSARVGTTNTGTVTLKNVSNAALRVLNVSADSPEFVPVSHCSGPLNPGISCAVDVGFTPPDIGDFSATLSIEHTGMGTPQVISMTGRGFTNLRITPSQLDFGDQQVGTTSNQQALLLSNQSFAPITISNIDVSGDFQMVQNPCPNPLPAFFGCNLQIVFSPTDTGSRTGSISITASDYDRPHVVPLMGNGTP